MSATAIYMTRTETCTEIVHASKHCSGTSVENVGPLIGSLQSSEGRVNPPVALVHTWEPPEQVQLDPRLQKRSS